MDLKYYFAYMSFNLYHICCIQHFMLFSFSFFGNFCVKYIHFFKKDFQGKTHTDDEKVSRKNTKTHALSTIIEVDLAIVIIIIY